MRRADVRLLLAMAVSPALIPTARAEFLQPPAAPLADGATLFVNQCGVCHSLNADDPPRQGPLLKGVVGRRAGTLPGFRYSPGFAKADFIWDEPHLDRWLTDPQALIPGAVMLYRQSDPAVRARIIGFLKEQR
ncbi:MAG TPA: c-type cytochrome [Acetobacteraceae bacterium]|nr:c-type cytochrome [Acetobacteraceae bacterium]